MGLIVLLLLTMVTSVVVGGHDVRHVRNRRALWPGQPNHPFPDSSWSDWIPCSNLCDGGYQARHNCSDDYVIPTLVGYPPFGVEPPSDACSIYYTGCNGFKCEDGFDWQPFGPCNVTCGTGSKSRDTGPACTWLNCPNNETYTQTISCNSQSCDPVLDCGKADIVFVLDSSGSIGDYHFIQVKQFAIDVVKALDIGSETTRVAVVTFSTGVKVSFDMDEHMNTDDLEAAIWGIQWMGDTTNTQDAILKARMVFGEQARSDPDIKKIMIVVTDGNSNILEQNTVPQATLAKEEGIITFVIGIGYKRDIAELTAIGSTPSGTFVHYAPGFEALSEITQLVVQDACVSNVNCSVWSDWSECSVTCGVGDQDRTSSCWRTLDDVIQQTWTKNETQVCDMQCTLSCGNWTEDGLCSVTCGTGLQPHQRVCSTTSDGGAVDTDTQRKNVTCFNDPCVGTTCTEWSDWYECSVTCSQGEELRVRNCTTTIDGVDQPVNTETDTRTCSNDPCTETNCTPWGDWTCSVTCGQGVETQTRDCVTTIDGIDQPTETHTNTGVCSRDPCTETNCTPWGDWTCSVTCGQGVETQTRDCVTTIDGIDQPTETQTNTDVCSMGPCMECQQWSNWTECSTTCDAGSQDRSRTCQRVVNGVVKASRTESQTQTCLNLPCIVDPTDCRRCEYEFGIGFLEDPEDPCMYYKCERWDPGQTGQQYQYVRHHMPCGAGTLWDQSILTCNHDTEGMCAETGNGMQCYSCQDMSTDEECTAQGDETCKKDKDVCMTLVEDLPQGIRYTKGCKNEQACLSGGFNGNGKKVRYCCNSADLCNINHFDDWDVEGHGGNGVCDLKAVAGDDSSYLVKSAGQIMPCAAGTVFDQDECGCVHGGNPNPGPQCDGPLLYFSFDTNFDSGAPGCEQASVGQAGGATVELANDSVNGKSAKFDGTSLLTVPFLNNYFTPGRGLDTLTVALWFKWTGDATSIGGLVNNGNCEDNPSFDIHVGPGGVSASIETDVGVDGTDAVSVGRWDWIHVTEVYDGSNLRLYVNGVQQKSLHVNGAISNKHCSMIIGQLGDEAAGFFEGFIDELYVYTEVLDDNEIVALYNNP